MSEQERVAVGPGNAHRMSTRQVSLRRGTCWHCGVSRCCYCSAATAAAVADAIRQFTYE